MRKFSWLLVVLAIVCLIGCSRQDTDQPMSNSSSEEQVVKTQVFDLELTNDQKQRQTVVYKGDQIQKLVLQNTIAPNDEITKAISEVGVDETKRLLQESLESEEAYKALENIEGLTYELQFDDPNNIYILFTMDVLRLDTVGLSQTDLFKGSGLEDVQTLTAEQYLKRLEAYGAQPVTP